MNQITSYIKLYIKKLFDKLWKCQIRYEKKLYLMNSENAKYCMKKNLI